MATNVQAKTEVQARYDGFARRELNAKGTFEEIGPSKAYFRVRKLETALRMGSYAPGAHLLEIGCSIGQYSFALAQKGFRVTGADLSPESIRLAQERLARSKTEGLRFVNSDAEDLGQFPDNYFDGVLSFSTLRYVPDLFRACAEISRVLKPGGRAVVDFPNRWCPWFYLKPWLGSERHPHDRWFTPAEVARVLEGAGLRTIGIRRILFTPTVLPGGLLPVFKVIDAVGERIPLVRNTAGIIIAVAQKS